MSFFPYTISSEESIGTGLVQILRRIAAHLGKLPKQPGENSLHEVRTTIKLLRTLLWLAKPALPAAAVNAIKIELHQAAEKLAGPRDAKVLHITLGNLVQEATSEKQKKALRQASEKLDPLIGRASISAKNWRSSLQMAQRAIRDFERGVAAVPVWKSPQRRLRQAFKATAQARRIALKGDNDLAFHSWRKKAKRLYYLLLILDPHPGRKINQLITRVDKIQYRLGDYHDLAVLESKLRKKRPERQVRKPVLKLLQKRKRRLADRADIKITKSNRLFC